MEKRRRVIYDFIYIRKKWGLFHNRQGGRSSFLLFIYIKRTREQKVGGVDDAEIKHNNRQMKISSVYFLLHNIMNRFDNYTVRPSLVPTTTRGVIDRPTTTITTALSSSLCGEYVITERLVLHPGGGDKSYFFPFFPLFGTKKKDQISRASWRVFSRFGPLKTTVLLLLPSLRKFFFFPLLLGSLKGRDDGVRESQSDFLNANHNNSHAS